MKYKLKRIFLKYRLEILFIISVVILAGAISFDRIYTSDFIATNGDFQNYNIFRRVLDFQIPYYDFANYLGFGMIIMNVPFLFFANNFTASIFVTYFTTCIIYSLMITIFMYLLTRKKHVAYILGAVVPIAAFILYKFVTLPYWLYQAIQIIVPGNSMRPTRAFLPFLIIACYFLYKKGKKEKIDLISKINNRKFLALTGVVMGISTLWSNDTGFATLGCSCAILILHLLFMKGKVMYNILNLILFILAAIGGMVIGATIVTLGHPLSYLDFTLGVMDYQFWYYGIDTLKVMSVPMAIRDITYIVLLVIFVFYGLNFTYKIMKKKVGTYDVCMMFLVGTSCLSSLIYLYGSGYFYYDTLALLMYLFIGFHAYKFLIFCLHKVKKIKKVKLNIPIYKITIVCLSICICVNMLMAMRFTRNLYADRPANTAYVEGLHGYTKFGDSINRVSKLLEDKSYFSTYSTALETVNNVFQPSNVDYIIHAMGKEQQQKYLNTFIDGKYEYASTISENYSDFEYWIKRANWYFYRELYKNYTPVDMTDYSVIWKRTDVSNVISPEYELEVNRLNEYSYEIIIKTETKEYMNADLKLSYKTSWNGSALKNLAYKRALSVNDGGIEYFTADMNECYFLPAETEEHYIPMSVENGRGRIVLSSTPNNSTKLDELEVEVGSFYHNFAMPLVTYDLITESWDHGVLKSSNQILFRNNPDNKNTLHSTDQLTINGITKNIAGVFENNYWLIVTFEDNADIENFKFGSIITPNKSTDVVSVVPALYSDNNWINGISTASSIILFENNPINLERLKNKETLSIHNITYEIDKIETNDEWINVTLKENIEYLRNLSLENKPIVLYTH